MTGKITQARHVIDRLGGRAKAQEITGFPLSKIDSMLRMGWIQGKDQRHMLESAIAARAPLTALDFVVHLVDLHASTVTTPPRAE